jgi:hypothetical protein
MIKRLMSRALQLAHRGWHVFPIRPGDKRPLRGFRTWEAQATTDRAQIVRWWSAAPYNIGIACGPSKLLVVDCDTGEREDGLDVLLELIRHGAHELPETLQVTTPSGGRHLYFTAPDDTALGNTAGKLGSCIDTRGVGGYVVAAGSVRPEGYYTVTKRACVAPLPVWLINTLTPAAASTPTLPLSVHQHQDHYVRAILEGEAERVRTATPGSRNNAFNTAAFIMGQLVGSGEITEQHAWSLLRSAGRLHIGVKGFTEDELERTTKSGLTAGMRRPRSI